MSPLRHGRNLAARVRNQSGPFREDRILRGPAVTQSGCSVVGPPPTALVASVCAAADWATVNLLAAQALLTSQVGSRQYSLWLVPLVAVADEPPVAVVRDQGTAGPNHAIYYGWFAFIVLIRDAFLLAILALVGWEMWHPEADVVRADGADDPSGGVFDRAADVFSLSSSARAERRRRAAAALADPVDVVEVGSG